MEKFGIFNILSALNSLTGGQAQKKTNDTPAADAPPANGSESGKLPNAFAPPPAPPAYKAMLDVMNRHDEISKRIDEKNKK